MATYTNVRQDSAISSVEFSSSAGMNFSFFYLRDAANKEVLKQWLSSGEIGLDIVAQTQQNGQHIFVAKGTKAPAEILSLLAIKGNSFTPYVPKKPFQAWKWRGKFSIVGQLFELISVFVAQKNGTRTVRDNAAYLTYSTANLAAAFIDIIFGASVIPDIHRMRALKTQVNDVLKPYLPEGAVLPSPDANLTHISGQEKTRTFGQRSHDYIQRHSVYIETALRYLGAFGLAFPVKHWKPAWKTLRSGTFAEAIKTAANDNPITFASGLFTLGGKTITLFSKAPDPYSPAPATPLDSVRENVTFKLGTAVESVGAIAMAHNGFKGSKIGGVVKTNPIAGAGNLMFIASYGARWFAPFGVRKMDVPELEAHISEGLANVPPEKLPQLITDIAISMKQNLQDEPLEFGQLYAQILDDLSRRHPTVLRGSSQKSVPLIAEDIVNNESKKFATDRLKNNPVTMHNPMPAAPNAGHSL